MVRKAIAPKSTYYFAFIGQVLPLIFSIVFLEIALHFDVMPATIAGLAFFVLALLLFVRFLRKCIYLYLVGNDEIEFGSVFKLERSKINEVVNLRKGIQRKVYFIEISGKEYFLIASIDNADRLKNLLLKK